MELPQSQSRRVFLSSPPIADLLAEHPKALSADDNQYMRLAQEIHKLQLELKYKSNSLLFNRRVVFSLGSLAFPLFIISVVALLPGLFAGTLPSWVLSFQVSPWPASMIAFVSGIMSGLMMGMYSSLQRRSREVRFLEESLKIRIDDLGYIHEITPES